MDTITKRKALAKERIWKEVGLITQQLVEVTEDLLDYLPLDGTKFCVVCGNDTKFSRRDHLRVVHPEERQNDLELAEQLSCGVLEKERKASVDCPLLVEPVEPGEWKIYEGFVEQLTEMGLPIHKPHTRPSSKELGRQPPSAGCVTPAGQLPCSDQPSTSTAQQEAAIASTNGGTRRRRKSGLHSKIGLLE
ncbi:unnamed protein product [Heligmosomoides polygyrus]|uniref:C2H2-type domain-containing protein n=1 Tax=Heligmosomoides polygyrus TaxID=6339 RepID=A0A183GTA3_HELPZ|nr:unnamed protein product [Heligmosomoides polygyrus]